jgi:hypothetical protein
VSKMNFMLSGVLALTMVAGFAMAQPGEGRPPAPGTREGGRPPKGGPRGGEGAERDPGMFDPAAMKARLERRLEEVTREQTRIREALEKLSKGEAIGELERGMQPGRRPGRFDGPRGERPEGQDEDRGPRGGKPDGPRDEGRPERGPHTDGGKSDSMRGEPSPEEREQMMAVLREAMPGLAKRVEEAQKTDPEAGRRLLGRWAPRLREAIQLREREPKLFELRVSELREGWKVLEAARNARDLARTSHDGEDKVAERRAKAQEELKSALAGQFDARLALQSHEVQMLSKRLEELNKRLAEQRASREDRIKETAERILNDKDLPLEGGEGRPPRGEKP